MHDARLFYTDLSGDVLKTHRAIATGLDQVLAYIENFSRGIDHFFSFGVCFFTKGSTASSISGRCGANLNDEFAIKVVAARVFVTGCKLSLYWSW